MRIGRLEFGIIKGSGSFANKSPWKYKDNWGYTVAICRCRILSLGLFYFTWLDKECKCVGCGQYTCVCNECCDECDSEYGLDGDDENS
jgi:hypothetical protein